MRTPRLFEELRIAHGRDGSFGHGAVKLLACGNMGKSGFQGVLHQETLLRWLCLFINILRVAR